MLLVLVLVVLAAANLAYLAGCRMRRHNPCAELEALLVDELENPKPQSPTPTYKSSEPKPPECPGCPGGGSKSGAKSSPARCGLPGIGYERMDSDAAKYEISRKRTDSPGSIEYCVTVRKK